MFIYVVIGLGAVLALFGIIFMRPIAVFLGANGNMLEYCVQYGRVILVAMPFFMLQNSFQNFFVMAEKPNLGLGVTVISGVLNIALDAILNVNCDLRKENHNEKINEEFAGRDWNCIHWFYGPYSLG